MTLQPLHYVPIARIITNTSHYIMVCIIFPLTSTYQYGPRYNMIARVSCRMPVLICCVVWVLVEFNDILQQLSPTKKAAVEEIFRGWKGFRNISNPSIWDAGLNQLITELKVDLDSTSRLDALWKKLPPPPESIGLMKYHIYSPYTHITIIHENNSMP